MGFRKYSRQELIDEIHRFVNENGRPPRLIEMSHKYGYIPIYHYNKEFGGINNALITAGYKPNICKGYTREYLTQSIQNYYNMYKKVPTIRDIRYNTEYPSEAVYTKEFGSFNNAITVAGFTINKEWHLHSKHDICVICGECTTNGKWYYKNSKLVCNKCYTTDRLYLHGTSNINSTTGIGIITETVVAKVLNDCVKCNTQNNFNGIYDLISDRYGNINVKSCNLYEYSKNHYKRWSFSKYLNSKIPDYYICIGFNEDKTEILHVWFIPGTCKLVRKFNITIALRKLERAAQYEVDATPYNEVYQNLDIYTLPEFCNLPREDITNTTVPSTESQEVS